VRNKSGRRYIVLARLSLTASGFEVTPLANQCSALVRTSADANAFIVLTEGGADCMAGDTVEVQVLEWEHVVGSTEIAAQPAAASARL